MPIIVGLDPGLTRYGAVALLVPERVVVAADVWTSSPDPGVKAKTVTKTADYAARGALCAHWLNGTISGWGPVHAVAAEGTSGMGGSDDGRSPNMAAVFTVWGVTIGVAALQLGRPLYAVHQATWKRHVVGPKVKVTDEALYPALRAVGLREIDAQLRARRRTPGLRVHALDALGVALYAARMMFEGSW